MKETLLKRERTGNRTRGRAPEPALVVFIGGVGRIRLLSIETYLQTRQQRETVRLIYFLPRNRSPQRHIDAKLDTLIRDVQQFYQNLRF